MATREGHLAKERGPIHVRDGIKTFGNIDRYEWVTSHTTPQHLHLERMAAQMAIWDIVSVLWWGQIDDEVLKLQ